MRQFRTVLLLSLAAIGCGSAEGGNTKGADEPIGVAGVGGADQLPNNGGAAGSDAGSGGSDSGGASGSSQGGAGGSAGAGGSSGEGGASGSSQGGAGGTTAGSGGSDNQGGAGGSDQGGSGGTDNQGGAGGTENQGGTGGSDPLPPPDPPPPACTFALEQGGNGSRCTGLLFETCTMVDDVPAYQSTQCGLSPETGMHCDEGGGCVGVCTNGSLRCTGSDVELCAGGIWEVAETCAFQCVNGACEGACTPGNSVCDGASVVTCAEDFRYGDAVACSEAPNAAATCSGAGECGTSCLPGFDDCTGAAGCETDLSSVDACGACGNACPGAPNATRTCNGGVCGLTPNACAEGTANCTGDFVCETDIDSDENNCGGCGIQCFAGATCNDGACSIETVSDFSAVGSGYQSRDVIDMVLDGGYLYWWVKNAQFGDNQHAHAILRAPTTGGAPETLTTFTLDNSVEGVGARDNALLVDNGQLYWARETGIFRMPTTGGTVTKIANERAASLAIDGGKLYWNDVSYSAQTCLSRYFQNYPSLQNCNAYTQVTFFALNLTTLAKASWQTNQYEYGHVLGVQGTELFVTRYTPINVNSAPRYRSTILVLNAATGAYTRTVVDAARVEGTLVELGNEVKQAVFTGSSLVLSADGTYQVALSGGEASKISNDTPSSAEGLAADTDSMYVSNPGFSVSRVSRSTLTSDGLFGNPGASESKIALDATHIYWTVDVGGKRAVLRTAK